VTAAAIPEERALRDPRGACIADERQELDNTQFAQTVAAVAAVFAAAGLGSGDVLAIMLPNRVELVTSMFAAWRLGTAVTPVNPALTAQAAQYAFFGEQPVAFVALRHGQTATPDDLVDHCRTSLAHYKVPREVYIEEALPKNAVGKIAKPVLRERLGADPSRGTRPSRATTSAQARRASRGVG
jgi:acyl-CoA synthetase (AMP-forming)/AMP-acid ligase II